jgi:DNA polymerase-3 subunit delta'
MKNIYLWQKNQWQQLMQKKQQMHHALLLKGQSGIGKYDFAHALANGLLCSNLNTQLEPCESCASCNWFTEGTHPDFRQIGPEDADTSEDTPKKKNTKKSQISVDQIRQLNDYLSLSNHQINGLRVILISPADSLNNASANALLKMLEEPPINTVFILVTSHINRLLPTIISRCQLVEMPIPPTSEAIRWLENQQVNSAEQLLNLAGGSPLLALSMVDTIDTHQQFLQMLTQGRQLNASQSAVLGISLGTERVIEILQKWCFDLISYRLTQSIRYHQLHLKPLQLLAKSVNLSSILVFCTILIEAKKWANHPLNQELQLEGMMLQYIDSFKPI